MSVYDSDISSNTQASQTPNNTEITQHTPPIINSKKRNGKHSLSSQHNILNSILPDSIDADTLLIAALLFLLLKEGGDIKLVIALGYILL